MGTVFETVLVGEHDDLTAIAEAVLDEVVRVERLLSRFDPRSEISRINREAFDQDILIDRELADLLTRIDRAWHETSGAFDITAGSPGEPRASATGANLGITWADVTRSSDRHTIRFRKSGMRLDCGGFGKGYALDRASEILNEYGVERSFVHGGTSSAIARGKGPGDEPWRVRVGNQEIELDNAALSCSATSHGGERSDIVDPQSAQPVAAETSVVVLGPSGLETEILSTALVCLGKKRCESLLKRCESRGFRVMWNEGLSLHAGHSHVEAE